MKQNNSSTCPRCLQPHLMTVTTREAEYSVDGAMPSYVPPERVIAFSCGCWESSINDQWLKPKTKETSVTKQFDTGESKNTALNTIVSKVEAVERALFNAADARAKLDLENHAKVIKASMELDCVLMEALQSGVGTGDYEAHLPEYADNLSLRAAELIEMTQLAKVVVSL